MDDLSAASRYATIHPCDMKDSLGQIDPDDAQLLLHGTRLLLGGMISFYLKSF
jgi:hypothetical protein